MIIKTIINTEIRTIKSTEIFISTKIPENLTAETIIKKRITDNLNTTTMLQDTNIIINQEEKNTQFNQ